jgi:hypothetical protein
MSVTVKFLVFYILFNVEYFIYFSIESYIFILVNLREREREGGREGDSRVKTLLSFELGSIPLFS